MYNYALLTLFNRNHEVLLFKRINTSFGNGQYCLPGGKIEAHETARQAIIREACEEIGVSIELDDLKFEHVFHRKGTDAEFFALIFSAANWHGTPTNNEPDKHADMAWFSLDNLPENLLPAHRQVIECISAGVQYSEHGW